MLLTPQLVLVVSLCFTQAHEDIAGMKAEMTRMRNELGDRIAIMEDELADRVSKLEDLAKVGTLRSCSEYAQYGLKTSGPYMVDPDGALIGQEPFQVYCDFATGATEVIHDSENVTEVQHCHDPGCYQKNITYINGLTSEPISMYQIVSLIELAAYCEQEIRYDCTLAPLNTEDIDYAFWEDRQGDQNVYFTGENYGFHVCDCHYTSEGCMEEEVKKNTCNCDANLPIPLSDTGTITNMTALPVMKLAFGGLTYDLQSGAFQLGRLKCYGDKDVNIATSCSALKKKGEMTSGYYNIRPDGNVNAKLVFCDMKSGTYTDVPQVDQKTEESSPLGTILAWVPRPQSSLAPESLPDGWLPCDGSTITKGPWSGGKTPDLNTVGAFLRGGEEDNVLEMEDDQVQDHHHEDPGHSHSCSASSSASNHHHAFSRAIHGESCASGSNHLCHRRNNYDEHDTESSSISVSTTCSASSHTASIGGITPASRSGAETRPRNMKVRYIIRCW